MQTIPSIIIDVAELHRKFGVYEKIDAMSPATREQFLIFRAKCLAEELNELVEGLDDPEKVVDALIDLTVFAIGTLDLFQVDVGQAWNEVHSANMLKRIGIKPGRPNPFGLPDLIKPKDWLAPCHHNNHGILPNAKGN
jgi:hypothetical protein